MGEEQRKAIRGWTWFLVVVFIFTLAVSIGLGLYNGTVNELFTSWVFYLTNALLIVSIVGVFMYKKWGFYLFTIYVIYAIINNLINLDFRYFIIILVVWGYFIWYKGFYKNFKNLDSVSKGKSTIKKEAFSFTDLNITYIRFMSIFLLIMAPLLGIVMIGIGIVEGRWAVPIVGIIIATALFLFALWQRKRYKKK